MQEAPRREPRRRRARTSTSAGGRRRPRRARPRHRRAPPPTEHPRCAAASWPRVARHQPDPSRHRRPGAAATSRHPTPIDGPGRSRAGALAHSVPRPRPARSPGDAGPTAPPSDRRPHRAMRPRDRPRAEQVRWSASRVHGPPAGQDRPVVGRGANRRRRDDGPRALASVGVRGRRADQRPELETTVPARPVRRAGPRPPGAERRLPPTPVDAARAPGCTCAARRPNVHPPRGRR